MCDYFLVAADTWHMLHSHSDYKNGNVVWSERDKRQDDDEVLNTLNGSCFSNTRYIIVSLSTKDRSNNNNNFLSVNLKAEKKDS